MTYEFSVTWWRRDWRRTTPNRRVFRDLHRAEKFADSLPLRHRDLDWYRLERREVGPWIETAKEDAEAIRQEWPEGVMIAKATPEKTCATCRHLGSWMALLAGDTVRTCERPTRPKGSRRYWPACRDDDTCEEWGR